MPETPPLLPQDEVHIACPHCTIQIPAGVPVCPHCRQPVLPEEEPQRTRRFEAGLPAPAVLWERHGEWVKAEGRGEGALLRGETGMFEVEGVAKSLVKVVLRSEIVDLGMGRDLIPSRRRR